MNGSRSSGVFVAVSAVFLSFVAPLAAQTSVPIDILPTGRAAEPAPQMTPEAENVAPAPAFDVPAFDSLAETSVFLGVEVDEVQAIDPEAVGLFEAAEGGFGFDMWRGSSRPLVERLLPRLPVGTEARAMTDLARRLLLSTAQPPAGPRVDNLLAMRIERLAAMGDGVAVAHLLRAAPPGMYRTSLARANLDALLLTSDYVGACAQARDLVRRGDSPYWDKVAIFCQALNGQHDAAAMGVSLLREFGVEDDPVFEALLQVLSGIKDVDVSGLDRPTALHLAMLTAARRPISRAAVEGAGPAIARAIALSAGAPLELRLRAAERAEARGALPTETLAELYASVPFTTEELANPLSRAATDKGPLSRALLFQAVAGQVVPAARAEVLRACWQLGRDSGGWVGFASAARVTLGFLRGLTPSAELVWIAGDAARALLAAGRPAAALRWLEVAQQQSSVNAEAARTAVVLWPLIKLADEGGSLPWDDARLTAWWKAQDDMPREDREAKASLLFTLLTALGEDVAVETQLAMVGDGLTQSSRTLPPILWRQLVSAADDGRVGETVLLALIALDPSQGTPPGTLALGAAISALKRVGLDNEARALALETALASGF